MLSRGIILRYAVGEIKLLLFMVTGSTLIHNPDFAGRNRLISVSIMLKL